MALMLHLGGVGECKSLIWGWSVHSQESGDLQWWQRYYYKKFVKSLKSKAFKLNPYDGCVAKRLSRASKLLFVSMWTIARYLMRSHR